MAIFNRRTFLSSLAVGGLFGAAPELRLDAGKFSDCSADDRFLEELERATFQYFWECADLNTGLVKDRNHARSDDPRVVASIAATGFGLSALCIAEARGFRPGAKVRERVRSTLRFLAQRMPHERGFFYHFIDWRTGERQWKCELSSIDTALLLAGVLTCRVHFGRDAEIQRLATAIYNRIDWSWMLNGAKTLAHGWTPEGGFLKSRWNKYCELMLLYLLAIGAGKHPIPPDSWDAWQRPVVEYKDFKFISDGAPLFVHQYAHAGLIFVGCGIVTPTTSKIP